MKDMNLIGYYNFKCYSTTHTLFIFKYNLKLIISNIILIDFILNQNL